MHVQYLRMQCKSSTIGTCNTVKTEAIGGGAVENELSLYSWGARTNTREYMSSMPAHVLLGPSCQLSLFPKQSGEHITLPLVELH